MVDYQNRMGGIGMMQFVIILAIAYIAGLALK